MKNINTELLKTLESVRDNCILPWREVDKVNKAIALAKGEQIKKTFWTFEDHNCVEQNYEFDTLEEAIEEATKHFPDDTITFVEMDIDGECIRVIRHETGSAPQERDYMGEYKSYSEERAECDFATSHENTERT